MRLHFLIDDEVNSVIPTSGILALPDAHTNTSLTLGPSAEASSLVETAQTLVSLFESLPSHHYLQQQQQQQQLQHYRCLPPFTKLSLSLTPPPLVSFTSPPNSNKFFIDATLTPTTNSNIHLSINANNAINADNNNCNYYDFYCNPQQQHSIASPLPPESVLLEPPHHVITSHRKKNLGISNSNNILLLHRTQKITPPAPSHTAAVAAAKRRRDFQCGFCTNRFLRKQDMKRHEVTHTQVKKFVCANCGFGFVRRDALSRHMKAKRC